MKLDACKPLTLESPAHIPRAATLQLQHRTHDNTHDNFLQTGRAKNDLSRHLHWRNALTRSKRIVEAIAVLPEILKKRQTSCLRVPHCRRLFVQCSAPSLEVAVSASQEECLCGRISVHWRE